MRTECDESPVVRECKDCGEIFVEDDCPYCEPKLIELTDDRSPQAQARFIAEQAAEYFSFLVGRK